MRKKSLKARLIMMGLGIGMVVPISGTFIYFASRETAEINHVISSEKLAKTKLLGEMVFKFRDIRLQIRTTPVRGMTWDKIDAQIAKTKDAVRSFNETRNDFASRVQGEKEKQLFSEFQTHTDDFLAFGGELIELGSAHDNAKMDQVAVMVKNTCPEKAAKVEKAISDLIELQSSETKDLVAQSEKKQSQVSLAILLGSITGFVFAASLAIYISRRISNELSQVAERLNGSTATIAMNAALVSENGQTLAGATSQQASALQETVAAMEEISSMIERNSESARQSKELAFQSLETANRGRKHVEDLTHEVREIQNTTHLLMNDVQKGNEEIGRIIALIGEIESKTQVINDIVFQTKLLSFNASVEAARAGDAGSGFAVVAEEVGHLAAVSGNAAKEISDLLASSVSTVQEIVRKIQEDVAKQGQISLRRVERGIELGAMSGISLGEVLSGAKSVDEKVNEIAVASNEQSSGVREVTRSVHKMDELTQSSADISQSSAKAASELSLESQQLKKMVAELYATIHGGTGAESDIPSSSLNSFGNSQREVAQSKERNAS